MSYLECRHISKNFGGLKALSDVNFFLEELEIIGLIGPNGAGKTTLLNIIAGLYKPTAGEVNYKGQVISKLSPSRVCKKGIVKTFQIPQPFAGLTVLESVLVGHFFGNPGHGSLRVSDVLELTNLSHLKDELVENLGIESQKRVELAKALATNPSLLLLDEAAAGLNPAEQDNLVDLIRKLYDELKLTIIAVEHIMRVVMKTSHRIIVLNNGQVLKVGDPKTVSEDSEVLKAYLGEETIELS